MFVRQQVSKVCLDRGAISTLESRRDDRFAELVGQVAADPDNPFNIERYLWVLEEPPLRACATCGAFFDPWFGYDGGPGQGPTRRYCSARCRGRAAYERQRARLGRRCAAPYWQLDGLSQPCRVCGTLFVLAVTYAGTPTRSGRRRSFCSSECRARWTAGGVDQRTTAAMANRPPGSKRDEWRGNVA